MVNENGTFVHTSQGNTYTVTVQPNKSIAVEFDKGVFGTVENLRDLVDLIARDERAFNELMVLWDMAMKHNAGELTFTERGTQNGPMWESVMETVAECCTHQEFKQKLTAYGDVFQEEDFPPLY